MKPSEPTSLQGSFPVEQPSPVKAIAKAFRDRPITDFDLTADEGVADQPGVRASIPTDNEQDAPFPRTSTPSSPTPIIPRNGESGDPGERLRILVSNIATTRTGAYLVSKNPLARNQQVPSIIMPSTIDLPSPDWSILQEKLSARATRSDMILRIEKLESSLGVARAGILARNKVIEMDRASMVLQDLHLLKQQEALNAKPGKKKSKNRK